MDNTNIAWTRTTFTALWTGVAIYVAAKFGWELDPTDEVSIILVGLTGGVVWRASELLANVKYLGYILFGINKAPAYEGPTPPNPAEPAAPPVDAGVAERDLLIVITIGVVVILAILLL